MRIHCLSSITLEVENVDGKSEEEIAKEKNDAKMYALTIIEIGYSDIGRRNKEGEWCIEPSYKFLFIRDPSSNRDDLFDTILMTPGAMKIKDIDWKNFIIDIEFRQDKLKKSVLWMKSMRICNIKQVSTSTITKEERQKYRDYIECVNNYQLKNPGSTSEDAVDEIKMEKSVVEKTIKQTMRCIRDAITHLCDPENGSYKNIPTNARYKTKLQTFEETNREVTFEESNLAEIPKYFFQKLPTSLIWICLSGNNLKSIPAEISRLAALLTLILNNNPFLDDDGIPWLYLPTSIKCLDLSYSGITVVPETIQRLISLKELLLVGTKISVIF
uniref:Uncharacterized protein n=1 Tax=Panagrolaimus davidi TaxID=227884 RepID=A0A914P6B8_9BILA